jgi:hypothetical protein
MFGSEILDVAVGLIFVYLLLGLLCSVLNEWIARLFALRSSTLKAGIRNLLVGKDSKNRELTHVFYAHPLIKGLYRQGWFDKKFGREGKPSYISSRTFALALMDMLAPASAADSNLLKDVTEAVVALPDSDAKKSLLTLLSEAEGNIKKLRENIEKWFDDAMQRVSGWYKRKTQLITLAVAFVVSVGLNVDTFTVANSLYRDPSVRASVVAAAQEAVKQDETAKETKSADSSLTKIDQIDKELQKLRLPMGWHDQTPHTFWEFLIKFFGLLFTTFALSLGAPFWFDVLKKLTSLRSTGQEPEQTPKVNPG